MELRRSIAIFAALGMVAVLALPALGMPAAARESFRITVLAPLAMTNEWHGGAVIPIRVNVTDPDVGGREGASVIVLVNTEPATSPGKASMGNMMKDMGAGIYQFNLDTKPYPAGPGSEPIHIVIIAEAPDDHAGEIEILVSLT
jgi:hypothetical protein